MNPLKKLHAEQDQAVWLDFVARGFVQEGGLKRLVEEDGLRGVTSNPAIFEKAIGHSDEYDDALKRAKLAAKAGVIKGVLWHQGEADTVKQGDAESYEARLARMFKDLRADLKQPELPIVVGQLGDFLSETPEKNPHAETVRAALKHVPQAVPNVGFADSAGLNHKGDKLHFNAEGAKELGIRYSKAMQQIQKP